MAADAGPSSGHARDVLETLSRGESGRFARLVHPEVEIHTARGTKRGREAAETWAHNTYDHLDRRYEIGEMHVAGEDVLVLANVQYVWRESGEIGDSTPVAVLMRFEGGFLRRWQVFDDPAEGLKVFAKGVESEG
jgi:hypothetical protein